MNQEDKLEALSYVDNRSTGQMKMLFELCDNDFDTLLGLLARLKKYFYHACPGDKEEVKTWLDKSL